MIDLHCHLLPGVDDGPPTAEDAVALAQAFVATGTTTVVATPHVSWEYPDTTADAIASAVAEVRELLAAHGVPLTVHAGAEVAATRAFDLPDEELRALRLGDAAEAYLLLEAPLAGPAPGFETSVRALRERGHERLLLAHPERVQAFHREPDLVRRLVDAGAVTSVTASAFTGRFGREVQRFARHLLADGLVHSVASDAHSLARRPPGIDGPLRAAGLDADLIAWLGQDAPAAILAGRDLPPAPAIDRPAPRGPLARFRRAGSSR